MNDELIVRSLLAVAGIEPPEDEVQEQITTYAATRESLAALYAVDGQAAADGVLVFRSGAT